MCVAVEERDVMNDRLHYEIMSQDSKLKKLREQSQGTGDLSAFILSKPFATFFFFGLSSDEFFPRGARGVHLDGGEGGVWVRSQGGDALEYPSFDSKISGGANRERPGSVGHLASVRNFPSFLLLSPRVNSNNLH